MGEPNYLAGSTYPLGATVQDHGVNFCVYSKNAILIELLLFDSTDAVKPAHVIRLDPLKHRTYHYWHIFVPGLMAGQIYGFKAFGPFAPERGMRFDDDKVLLDPYGRAVAIPAAYARERFNPAAMKSVVIDIGSYDWDGDQPLRRSFAETIIYELHVRGFTRHPSSGVSCGKAGTYARLGQRFTFDCFHYC